MGVRWWKRLFADEAPPRPVLVRVADPSGALLGSVDVEVTWYPSGARAGGRHRTAAGLFVIPWRGDEKRAALRIRAREGEAFVEVERDRSDGDRVHELSLAPPRSASAALR